MNQLHFGHVLICFVAAILGLCVYAMVVDSQEMQVQQCVKTGNERETMVMTYIYNDKGAIVSMYPVFYTEYEYKCNDHNRWR